MEDSTQSPGGIPGDLIECYKKISLQLWIIIALLALVFIWLVIRKR